MRRISRIIAWALVIGRMLLYIAIALMAVLSTTALAFGLLCLGRWLIG